MFYSDLKDLLGKVSYKEGWRFTLIPSEFLPSATSTDTKSRYISGWAYLEVVAKVADSRNRNWPLSVIHTFPVPPLDYFRLGGQEYFERWILDIIIAVETHEACEFFRFDGVQTYFPDHKPGGTPYVIKRREAVNAGSTASSSEGSSGTPQ